MDIALKYGCNPHQTPASVRVPDEAGFKVLSGRPGYINFLDALGAWQLVRELKAATGKPGAASFKHVSPAGAAVAAPLSDVYRASQFLPDADYSPVATAYARARGGDRMCSFGDVAAVSDVVDLSLARLLFDEVSDLIIAPGYEPDALEMLKSKRNGTYCVLEIDPAWQAPEVESREVFGLVFEQRRNQVVPGREHLASVVTKRRDLPDAAVRDLILALITLKYTQSNSVCFAFDGQAIGIGAGQQSRIHCTRLAAGKADRWFLRQHPATLELPFRPGVGRPEQNNAVDLFLEDELSPAEEKDWLGYFATPPRRLTRDEKRAWLARQQGVSLASDAFFPFRDNVDRASQSGVKYISQPGGSVRDDVVVKAADEYDMVMAMSKLRLFHH